MQIVEVFGFWQPAEQGVRSWIVGGIVERLHRSLQQRFVTGLARPVSVALDIGAIGRKPQRYGGRQPGDRVGGAALAEAEAADHQRDARRAGAQRGRQQRRPGVNLRRPGAVGADARQQTVFRSLDQALVGRGRQAQADRLGHVDDQRTRRRRAPAAHHLDAAAALDLARGGRGGRPDRRGGGDVDGDPAGSRGPRPRGWRGGEGVTVDRGDRVGLAAHMIVGFDEEDRQPDRQDERRRHRQSPIGKRAADRLRRLPERLVQFVALV